MKVHAIDYFCKEYKLSLGDLSTLLGVKQPQINSWKKGRRKIPQHHKEEMCDIFSIPEDQAYLLEVVDIERIHEVEITIARLKATIKNEPPDSLILTVLKFDLYRFEEEKRIILTLKELNKMLIDSLMNKEKYSKNMDKLNGLMEEIRVKK